MTKDEALKTALAVLKSNDTWGSSIREAKENAIAAAEEALAQPEQEPVATVTSETGADITMSWWHEPALPIGTKLYTSPPQRTWVGLTDKERDEICLGDESIARSIEAELREKNGGNHGS